MELLVTLVLLGLLLSNNCSASVVINRYNDEGCVLKPELIREIQSYKDVTKLIMDNIKNTTGKEMYEEYTRFIDKFGARLSGSDNLEHAIDHMINMTHSYGLNDVTTEEVDAPHWVRGEETAFMSSPRKKHIAILGFGSSVPTPPEGITAEAIVVKSFTELEKMNDESVKGKIVVFNPPYVSYGVTVAYRSQGATKAAMKGAVATLVRSITPYSLYTLHTGAQFYGDNVIKIPTAAITVEDAHLLERLQKEGEKIVITIKMSNTFDIKKSRNTLVDLKGKSEPNKLVIVSGHIDSWDVGEGAMDDGGGMFISWFAPVLLNRLGLKPKRTVRAILWTAEEPGLVGAAAYLDKHKHELNDIDFIMESDEGTFSPEGLIVGGSNQTVCVIQEVLKLFSPVDKVEKSDGPGSDIVLIIKQGVPGASLMNKNERYFYFHHSEADTMDVQNKEDVIDSAAFWAAVSYVIADLSIDIPRF
ncbi:carboxypeptidase Q-like isoform X1 [Pectinophora gossypiella]|nr:carboxypeptidase Q-like isoform X1 [Pectinophora gossypiella]